MLKHASVTRPSSRARSNISSQCNLVTRTIGLNHDVTNYHGHRQDHDHKQQQQPKLQQQICDLQAQTDDSDDRNDLFTGNNKRQDLMSNAVIARLAGCDPIAQQQPASSSIDNNEAFLTKNKESDEQRNDESIRTSCDHGTSLMAISESRSASHISYPRAGLLTRIAPESDPSSCPPDVTGISQIKATIETNSPSKRRSPTKMLNLLTSSSKFLSTTLNGSGLDTKREIFSNNGSTNQLYNPQSPSTPTKGNHQSSAHATIKVFAQSLSQDVEYKTLQVTNQTRSSQIVRSLLKKFRLKHRDPNLYYLTLERSIRKDGIKTKNIMLLSDDACPLQLQQCCSNPPHNDIKFTLQMRAGALVKIYCSDVVQDATYKCLSLSTQTTVEETIDLMLHCLNMLDQTSVDGPQRATGSPVSIMSSSSSSSGIDSDPNMQQRDMNSGHQLTHQFQTRLLNSINDVRSLDDNSRASSVTSISTNSNTSSFSSSVLDQYCLIIECKDTNYRRILHSNEYLVDVYQGLLSEAKVFRDSLNSASTPTSPTSESPGQPDVKDTSFDSSPNNRLFDLVKTNPDQWFLIKLVRRDDYHIRQLYPMSAIKLTNPRYSPPPQLPRIPQSLVNDYNNNHNMRNVVSTTQIEVVNGHVSSHSFSGQMSNGIQPSVHIGNLINPTLSRVTSDMASPPSLPPRIQLMPPIKPRRNLSNVSCSSFGRPLAMNEFNNMSQASRDNRRRYDPAKLAEDLDRLDIDSSNA